MIGKVCLVTGANIGIGYITARDLARMGATVVLLCRSRSKGEAARDAIRDASGNPAVELLVADFASLASVRRAAAEFSAQYDRLHVLVNNAGLYMSDRLLSQDGYEMTIAVNHLAPFLLTNLLLDRLKAAAPARVVNVSSGAHLGARIDLGDLQLARRFDGFRAYANSKLANVLFTYELARRLEGAGVTATCLHPGFVASNFASSVGGPAGWFFRLAKPFARSPEQGARTSVYLASSPEVEGVTGKYFVDERPQQSSSASNDTTLQRRLWEESARLVGLS